MILAATDWSENARRAAQRAAYISGQRGAQGILLHVARKNFLSRAIDASAAAAFRASFARIDQVALAIRKETGFSFETQVHAGDVATSIARAAHVSGARLITLGQWTAPPLLHWAGTLFKGSIALRVLNQVSRPVLIVKKNPEAPYRRVVVAVDGTDSAYAHIQQAYALAPNAELILVHAMPHSPANRRRFEETFDDSFRQMRMRQHEDALDRINDLLERCGVPQQRVVKVVEFAYAPKLILNSEIRFAADLLVVGRSSSSRFRRLFFGGVTSHILARSRCDVLVVPSTNG